MVDSKEQIAYIAGVFDGEGHVSVRTNCRSVTAAITSTDVDILEKVENVFGGTIYGPYDKGNKPIYEWHQTGGRKRVWHFLDTVYPFLSLRRQKKIDSVELFRTGQRVEDAKRLREIVIRLIDKGGFSQTETAAKLGKSQSYISNLYNGQRGVEGGWR